MVNARAKDSRKSHRPCTQPESKRSRLTNQPTPNRIQPRTLRRGALRPALAAPAAAPPSSPQHLEVILDRPQPPLVRLLAAARRREERRVRRHAARHLLQQLPAAGTAQDVEPPLGLGFRFRLFWVRFNSCVG